MHPKQSIWDTFIIYLHSNGVGHFGKDKTRALLEERYHWPSMKKVNRFVEQCIIYQMEKRAS